MKDQTWTMDEAFVHSRFSLRPLYEALKKNITQGNPGAEHLYGNLLGELESHPELLEPVEDFKEFERHYDLINALFATVFPPQAYIHGNLYAIAFPFRFRTVYASRHFESLFLQPGGNEIHIPNSVIGADLKKEKTKNAYDLILKKFYQRHAPDIIYSVYPFVDPATGLTRYMELEIDTRFVDVTTKAALPVLGPNIICRHTNRLLSMDELEKVLPLDLFVYEGMVIVRVNDVTTREIVNQIRNHLAEFSFKPVPDEKHRHFLREKIQNLLQLKDLEIGITPLFKINDHYIFHEYAGSNSLLYEELSTNEEKNDANDCFVELFNVIEGPMVFETIKPEDPSFCKYVEHYQRRGVNSLIICPLVKDGRLLGILEIVSPNEHELRNAHAGLIKELIPLFALSLQKSSESLESQVDRIIKEKFTAIQPSVEWKFTEVALDYIVDRQKGGHSKISRISFENVYPLYGAIDVRNSSIERAQAIQLDLIDQLQMARSIVRKAQGQIFFPLLQELEFKIDKYISSASDILLSDEEVSIHEFLQDKVKSLLEHLRSSVPSVAADIDSYFKALDPQLDMVYRHRKEFEQSISTINDRLSRFIDAEQQSAQAVFPHYFERYVTDGVEFNIYIGQSIAPRKKFDELYLRNMKMWQLATLAKAARLTRQLEGELPHSLSTTQLILAHSIPLSISFRNAERKFDVDGAYNIRYEIVKKRIDKVRIKNSPERLTQPGQIAIVYSQPKEAAEYREFIEFLQNQRLLAPGLEEFELEELQGVVGMKALRVQVNFDPTASPSTDIELSETTSDKLLAN